MDFSKTQAAHPDESTNMLIISTLIEYQDQTAVVIELERQFLFNISIIRSFD